MCGTCFERKALRQVLLVRPWSIPYNASLCICPPDRDLFSALRKVVVLSVSGTGLPKSVFVPFGIPTM